MKQQPYNRLAAVAYAKRWAMARNPAFYDFSELGGDCCCFANKLRKIFIQSAKKKRRLKGF